MTTWTEIVATVVVHSSTAALSHFGVTLEPAAIVQPAPAPTPVVERVVSRSPKVGDKLINCPKIRAHAAAVKA